ncbi:ABC transporter ATP-binding protein, partial [Devosia sp.]|uniref:ABC transporter ATP-binding protein n=1 Tax=Devosia sp. TaxID=1871048 RepID=UPI001AC3D4CE
MTKPLSIRNITAHYGQTKVLEDLSLDIAEGELVSLLGASGCGKTTTLRLVAGFLQPTSGSITLGGKDLTKLPAHQRDIGLVFQNYALFPHLTVADNVGFGLKQRGVSGEAKTKRVGAMLERVGLGHLADRLPGALSGGQKQRVALARALVIEP